LEIEGTHAARIHLRVQAERHRGAGVAHLPHMLGSLEGFSAIRAFVMDDWLMWDYHHHQVEGILDLGRGVGYTVIRGHGRRREATRSLKPGTRP
jgi:hypothetical protein